MSRFAYFLAGFLIGAWCAGLALRWEQLRPQTPPPVVELPLRARTLFEAWRDLEGVDSV